MNAAAKSRGFTLIELLAAMTLLALLATILMGTVRGAERSTGAATDLSDRTEQYARSQAFLREHVAGILPMRWRRELGQPLKFAGDADKMTYLAPITSQIADGGVQWWQLALATKNDSKQLVLRRRPVDPEEKAIPDVSGGEAVVLAERVQSLVISYFDQGDDPINNPDSATWVDSWNEGGRMPAMVKIRIVEAGGRAWPDMVISLRLTQALGCNFDFQRQRCLIPGVAAR